MKKIIFSLCCVLTLSVFSFAQKNNRKSPTLDESSGQQNQTLLESGTNIEAQLQSTLDVKKAKVGDEVVLKTTQNLKENGQIVAKKGTRLIGRVTEVQQKTKENAFSKIGIVIDRLEGNNLNVPLNASIVSMTQAAGRANVGDTIGSDLSGMSSSSGRTSSGGNGGGGLLGGATGAVGGVVSGASQTAGGVTNMVGQTVGATTNSLGNASQSLGRTVNGIQISNALQGSAEGSTTLSSDNKNLKIEKGVMFQLQLNQSVQN